MKYLLSFFLSVGMASGAIAQQVATCDDVHIGAIVEPWEENTRSFANGQIRIAVVDYFDPAVASSYLIVLYTPNNTPEAEGRTCKIISGNYAGFYDISLDGLEADYDPAQGLILDVPAAQYNIETQVGDDLTLHIVVNRATDQVTVAIQ